MRQNMLLAAPRFFAMFVLVILFGPSNGTAADAPARVPPSLATLDKAAAQVSEPAGEEGKLFEPPAMLGYAELMRLSPEARERYLQAIRDMVVEISLIRVENGPRLVVDSRESFFEQNSAVLGWLESIFPAARAAYPAVTSDQDCLDQKDGAGAFTKEEGKSITVLGKKLCVRAINLSTGSATKAAGCPEFYAVYQGGVCVNVAQLKAAYADNAAKDFNPQDAKTCKESAARLQKASGKGAANTVGGPCVYAGFIGKRTAKGCDRPPKTFAIGKTTVTCPADKIMCNPLLFGIAKKTELKTSTDAPAAAPAPVAAPIGKTVNGVCISPSMTATRDCSALSHAAGTKAGVDDGSTPLGQPLPPKDGYTRADKEATASMWKTESPQESYNKFAEQMHSLCSAENTNRNQFCQECVTMAARLRSANAVGAPEVGSSGSAPAAAKK